MKKDNQIEAQSEQWEPKINYKLPKTNYEKSVGSYEGPNFQLRSKKSKKLVRQFDDEI